MSVVLENIARVFESLIALQEQWAAEKATLLGQHVDVCAVEASLQSLLVTLHQPFDPRRIRLHGAVGNLQSILENAW